MVRYHKFLIAKLWVPEYGSAEDPEQFRWLYAYSPYHHVTPGKRYPAVLLSTAEGDSRVDPLHARKMAALLQSVQGQGPDRPVLLRIESRAGHGAGKPISKRVDEAALIYSFLFWQLGITP
jgi:prolyl oligopeptidase